jgi:hypothetical protein
LAKREVLVDDPNKIQLQLLLLFQVAYLSITQHIFQFKLPYEDDLAQVLELEYLYWGIYFWGVVIINPNI